MGEGSRLVIRADEGFIRNVLKSVLEKRGGFLKGIDVELLRGAVAVKFSLAKVELEVLKLQDSPEDPIILGIKANPLIRGLMKTFVDPDRLPNGVELRLDESPPQIVVHPSRLHDIMESMFVKELEIGHGYITLTVESVNAG